MMSIYDFVNKPNNNSLGLFLWPTYCTHNCYNTCSYIFYIPQGSPGCWLGWLGRFVYKHKIWHSCRLAYGDSIFWGFNMGSGHNWIWNRECIVNLVYRHSIWYRCTLGYCGSFFEGAKANGRLQWHTGQSIVDTRQHWTKHKERIVQIGLQAWYLAQMYIRI